jgi:2'-phosphotransferase
MTEKSEKEYVKISKSMTYILRHGIIDRSINIDKDGYVMMDDLMKQPEMKKVSIDDIKHVVKTSDKKRFSLKEIDDVFMIRANQGHSKEVGDMIDDETLLTKITEPLPMCVHGTDHNAWKVISKTGLSPMKRKHIHLASGLAHDASVVSGMRKNSKVVIHIDMKKAIDKGKTFYLSSNGVILTPDVLEPDLFSKIQFN